MESVQRIGPALTGALFTPLFEKLYGSGETVQALMLAIVFFIAMDWMSGTRASKKDKSYASKYGLDGVFRTFFILLLPAGGHLLDAALGLPGILFGLLSFGVLYHVIQSMTANSIRAGWGEWVPEWLLSKITEWVKSELEAKVSRAEGRREQKRLEGKDDGENLGA
ncbi:phage holin family protein [Pseudobacillus wudalianchiensis]|uniref:Holin n=1 Tax=Pseudobacillus wudalianchiensis TaxID=1743143 RepID=A0A1B9AMR8_9BACI|nr:phage holin family protein [Bacillus wudalianchiensis]OCA85214.1 holin [Bacillus wudalianchiensis]